MQLDFISQYSLHSSMTDFYNFIRNSQKLAKAYDQMQSVTFFLGCVTISKTFQFSDYDKYSFT